MELYIRLEAPFEWVRVDGKKVEAFGEVPTLDDYPLSEEHEVIGVVPGEWVTAHRVSIPAKSRKQFQAAVPYALEESISEEVDQMHFVCPGWKSGEENIVLVVAKEKMREWQSLANQHRLPVSALIADHALIPMHDAAECSLALHEDQILAADRTGYGVSVDQEFLDVWLMDVPMDSTIAVSDKNLTEKLIERNPDRDFRHWPFGNKMAHWLEYSHEADYDLWSDNYRPSVSNLGWRAFIMPAIVLALAVLVKFGYDTYRYLALHAEVRAINAEMQEIVLSTFPEIDVVPVDNEQFMMQQALNRRNTLTVATGVPPMLAETAAVLRRERVTLESIVYRDARLIINCLLNDFSQVDQITRKLNARPRIQATLQSSASDDGQITASYAIRQS